MRYESCEEQKWQVSATYHWQLNDELTAGEVYPSTSAPYLTMELSASFGCKRQYGIRTRTGREEWERPSVLAS